MLSPLLGAVLEPLQTTGDEQDGPDSHVHIRRSMLPHRVEGHCVDPAPATGERRQRRVKPFLKAEDDKACAETPPDCGHLLGRGRLFPMWMVWFTAIEFHAVVL